MIYFNAMSNYAIFTNIEKKTLVFYPVPKNANSSAKYFLIKQCGLEDKFITPKDLNNPNQMLSSDNLSNDDKNKPNISSFIPSKIFC